MTTTPSSTPPRGTTAEHARLAEATGRPRTTSSRRTPGTSGARTCPSGPGARCARTTATDGDAWDSFPHDHARSRAYRWNEDGMAGISDIRHELCLALALWNGADPILKERMFGLTGPQGNHGEDVKEYWWYLDALPSHAWLRWRYHYPQAAFPYQQLVDENARRSRDEPEFELLDTGVFDDDRYWSVDVTYAKASPTEVLCPDHRREPRPEEATLVGAADPVVPQHAGGSPATQRRRCSWTGTAIAVEHPRLAGYRLEARARRRRACGRRRCSATTRRTRPRVFGARADHRRTRRTASTTTSSPARRP